MVFFIQEVCMCVDTSDIKVSLEKYARKKKNEIK